MDDSLVEIVIAKEQLVAQNAFFVKDLGTAQDIYIIIYIKLSICGRSLPVHQTIRRRIDAEHRVDKII